MFTRKQTLSIITALTAAAVVLPLVCKLVALLTTLNTLAN